MSALIARLFPPRIRNIRRRYGCICSDSDFLWNWPAAVPVGADPRPVRSRRVVLTGDRWRF